MIGAGFIGCGSIAVEHLEALRRVPGIEPRGYVDVDPVRARDCATRYGGTVAADVESLLGRSDIAAVYICTHHDSHRQLAVDACRAGKHVMIEKPMALTVEDCRIIVDEVKQAGVILMTAFKLRYYPMVTRAREFAPSPLIGTAHVFDNRWRDDFWAQDPLKGGGNVLSQGVHAMDLVCHLFDDEPVRIHAEGGALTHPGPQPIDTIVATVRFRRGGVASIAVGDAGLTPYASKFSFQIADGRRTVHLHDRLRAGEFYDGERLRTIRDDDELGMIEENREFVRAVAEQRPPTTTAYHGLRATSMVLAAFRSIATGEPQVLSLHDPL